MKITRSAYSLYFFLGGLLLGYAPSRASYLSMGLGRALVPAASARSQDPAPAAPPQGQSQEARPSLKQKTELVSLSVTVEDAQDHLVAGLDPSHFAVYDHNVKQQIDYFTDEDIPLSIGILFDMSGSMVGYLSESKAALKAFVQTCHQRDDFFLDSFNQRQHLWGGISDGTPLIKRIDLLTIGGGTALYDSILFGVEKVKEGRHRKRALLVISDGRDTRSHYQFDQLIDRIREDDVQIYCVGVGDTEWRDTESREKSAKEVLEMIAAATGGEAFFPFDGKEMEKVMTHIALELRHQYGIGYYPNGLKRDGQWHKIKVSLVPPPGRKRLRVRAKQGYYAYP